MGECRSKGKNIPKPKVAKTQSEIKIGPKLWRKLLTMSQGDTAKGKTYILQPSFGPF